MYSVRLCTIYFLILFTLRIYQVVNNIFIYLYYVGIGYVLFKSIFGWDNLLQGKFTKDWRKLNRAHNNKMKDIYKQKEETSKATGGVQLRSHNATRYGKEKEKKKSKQKADVFQRVFTRITRIIQEL